MLAISLTVACSRYVYNGVILHAHPVRGESHNQRNATGEVATLVLISVRHGDAGDAVAFPNAEKLAIFGQSIQLHSHVSEVVSIFQTKAK